MTRAGKGGTALGITMIAAFFAASVGIIVMIFASPLLVSVAFKFGPSELFSIMLLGLLAGGTMSSGSPLKGVSMTVMGLLIGVVGTDVNSGTMRFTFGMVNLADGVELVALALGLFGVTEFLRNVNRLHVVGTTARYGCAICARAGRNQTGILADCARHLGGHPVRRHAWHRSDHHHLHCLCAGKEDIQVARALRSWRTRRRCRPRSFVTFKTQVDFIPTMSLGIPGDPVMALLLGALLIQGIQPDRN